jgi:hypothetical protein
LCGRRHGVERTLLDARGATTPYPHNDRASGSSPSYSFIADRVGMRFDGLIRVDVRFPRGKTLREVVGGDFFSSK